MQLHPRELLRSLLISGASLGILLTPLTSQAKSEQSFNRIASFPVYLNTDIETESVAEIVAASEDGNTLVYTDSENEFIGFVNISDPANPLADGFVAVGGEPTSVSVKGNYAVVGVNTSPSFIAPSGKLVVVDMTTRQVVAELDMEGQPDSVAISPDGKYTAVVIENERDEDLGDGEPPQAPSGFLKIVDMIGEPLEWSVRHVDFDGVADLFPEDAEPEYVDINRFNVALVTMQENNHLAMVYLPTGEVFLDYSAGTVDLDLVDTNENDLIEQVDSLTDVAREPDGATWVSPFLYATANEGDLYGGSRGVSIFNMWGHVVFDSGNSLDHIVASVGHYPEGRSENKGNEPENVEYGVYGRDRLLFVGSERANVVLVYELPRFFAHKPRFKQVLPAGVGPEGLLAIPERNLFIAASEKDERGDKYRSVINIYERQKGKADYPTIVSKNKSNGAPIAWAALSGLAIDKNRENVAYTIHDSFYDKSRIFKMKLNRSPAVIKKEIILNDAMGLLAAVNPNMVNADGTVNLDQEGIATRESGGFWVASEGAGTVGDESRPVETPNLLLAVSKKGLIKDVVQLPAETNEKQIRFGFEGVASVGTGTEEVLYVAFQREWAGDLDGHARIGRYEVATGEWAFYYYPLEAPLSANGGWVGLSEIVAIDDMNFAVVERDNQGTTDAVIKTIYRFSVENLTPMPEVPVGQVPEFPIVEKSLVRDLIPDIAAKGGQILEKIEGLAILPNGDALVVNDNDGVDDSNGETQLIKLKGLFK